MEMVKNGVIITVMEIANGLKENVNIKVCKPLLLTIDAYS